MPYDIAWEAHTVCVRFWGFVSPAEFLEGARRINADWRFDDMRFIVNDMLAVEGHEIDAPGVQDELLAMSLGALFSNPRARVVVVTCDSRLLSLARTMRQPPGVVGPDPVVCASMDEARDWMRSQPNRPTGWADLA